MANKVPLIQLQNVGKKYFFEGGDYYQALDNINLKIQEGEFVAIMGPSGSGKSTAMHILGALDTPTEGKYLFRGKNISDYSEDQQAEIRNKEIGFIFQAFNLLPRTTVLKNVERPMVYAGIAQEERTKKAMEALNLVGIEDKAHNLSNRISGGQIQRVAIARAIVMNPSIILADEPTGNLDTKTSKEILDFISKLNKNGKTIVLITHEENIASYAKRKIRFVDGKIISDTEKK
jgi:putative ABC transport system ATP-binding protein